MWEGLRTKLENSIVWFKQAGGRVGMGLTSFRESKDGDWQV